MVNPAGNALFTYARWMPLLSALFLSIAFRLSDYKYMLFVHEIVCAYIVFIQIISCAILDISSMFLFRLWVYRLF